MRRIERLTAWDIALVERVRRGGSAGADEWRRFAIGGADLDAWDTDAWDTDDGDEDDLDEDLPPIACDGSVCCPCGRCGGLEHC